MEINRGQEKCPEKVPIRITKIQKNKSYKASNLFVFRNISLSLLTGLIAAGLFSFGMYALATYGVDAPYPAGNTLNPECIPGSSVNCTVENTAAYFPRCTRFRRR